MCEGKTTGGEQLPSIYRAFPYQSSLHLSLSAGLETRLISLSPSRLFSLSLPPSLSSHHVQHRPSFLLHHFLHLPPSSPDFPSRFGLRPSKPSWSLILKPCPPPGFFTLSLHVNVHTTEKYWRKFPVHFVRSLKSCRTADSQEFLLRDLL